MRNRTFLVIFVLSLLFFSVLSISANANENYFFVTKWGSSGSGDGLFNHPSGVVVDSLGNVYVADYDNHRIQKFDSNGRFITKWGSLGSGDGQFNLPCGIAVDSAGNVYVTENNNHRIQKFSTSDGINYGFLTKWGSWVFRGGQFNTPCGIAVDSAGNVYVADYTDRIQKFDSNGIFITKWGSHGSGDGQFNLPCGIAVDSSGHVYVTDENQRIQKFDSNGIFITKWGSPGIRDGQFTSPRDVAVDSAGNVYVADFNNHRIQKFSTSDGINYRFLTKWGSSGSGDGQFSRPWGIAVDSSGNVYVTDFNNDRIQKFRPTEAGREVVITTTTTSRTTTTTASRFRSVPRTLYRMTTPTR